MQKRFSRMNSGNSTGKIPPTPSPHSTDDLLPTVEEDKQVCMSTTSSNKYCFINILGTTVSDPGGEFQQFP